MHQKLWARPLREDDLKGMARIIVNDPHDAMDDTTWSHVRDAFVDTARVHADYSRGALRTSYFNGHWFTIRTPYGFVIKWSIDGAMTGSFQDVIDTIVREVTSELATHSLPTVN